VNGQTQLPSGGRLTRRRLCTERLRSAHGRRLMRRRPGRRPLHPTAA